MFVMGIIASYKDRVWSLDFQIINQYLAMNLVLYTGEECLNQISKNHIKNNRKLIKSMNSKYSKYSKYSSSTRSSSTSNDTFEEKMITIISDNQLVIATLILLPITFCLTYQLNKDSSEWTPRQLMYLKFPGELFLRSLNALMVPLIITSLAYACTSIDLINSTDILYSITFYFAITTLLASLVGVSTVLLIGPDSNRKNPMSQASSPTLLVIDIILDILRNIFTDSLPGALTGSYFTVLVQPNKRNITHGHINNGKNQQLPAELWDITHKRIDAPNVSGLILFSMSVGLLAGRLGEHGKPIVDFIHGLNTILMTIIVTISYCAPIGTFFIIISQIINTDNIVQLLLVVAWFSWTVIIGLAIHLFLVLCPIFFIVTYNNPYKFLINFTSTISKAFGTDCSSVALADAMIILERMGYNKEVISFCIPLGSTLNMDGAALYQSIATIFLAHFLGIELNTSQILSIFITSAIISMGVAGMPQASLISIIIVLDTIGLKLEDAALVIMIDSILDRFRTTVNVFSDVFGAVIVSHLFRNTDSHHGNKDCKKNYENEFLEELKQRSRTPNLERIFSTQKQYSKCFKRSSTFNIKSSIKRVNSRISRFSKI